MNYRYQPPTQRPPDDDDETPYDDYEESPEDDYRQYQRYIDDAEPSDSGSSTPTWLKVIIGVGIFLIVASLVISMAGPVFFGNAPAPAQSEIEYESADFVSVVDSATIIVDLDGTKETVKMIGIERVLEPTWFEQGVVDSMEEIMTDTAVTLELAEVERDEDGNLLRYVILANNNILNGLLVANGLAYVGDVAPGNDRYLARMRGWEAQARAESLGVWSLSQPQ